MMDKNETEKNVRYMEGSERANGEAWPVAVCFFLYKGKQLTKTVNEVKAKINF
ncbi:hypothetical protein [Pygmaiobacter massiliensis]|uniref:hypothetical protein n=1 Tax=Pygmaiobacter massiliensis TaxID=1917873 RepID=UPI0015E09F98|nr:hypothetical protein [Pygmaiobacter massiliensis]